MKISETLDKAADHIVTHGWYQGYFWPNDGHELGYPPYVDGDPCCALGAIAVVEEMDQVLVYSEPMRFVGEHLGLKPAEVADWNDMPYRTKEEVLAALRGAAKRAEVLGK